MNKNFLPEHISWTWRILYLWLGVWALLSILSTCQWNTTDSDYQPLPKNPIELPKPEITELPKDTIDFSQCENYDDIIDLLEKKNHIKTIDSEKYFADHATFFKQSQISKEVFRDAYEHSDIVKYGVYTDDYVRNHIDKYLDIINQTLISTSHYTQYIDRPSQIVTSWLHGVVRKIYPRVDNPLSPKEEFQELPDIPIWSYDEESKYPRWIVRDSLQAHHIFLNSTQLWFKETGNNLAGDRTCIHGLKKNTLWFLIALSNYLQELHSPEICIKYKAITLRWGTEWYSHVDNPRHEHDHPGGEKIDFSIYAKRWVMLWIFFDQYGISQLQSADALSPIRLEVVGYEIEVIPHAAHFDILVIRKL